MIPFYLPLFGLIPIIAIFYLVTRKGWLRLAKEFRFDGIFEGHNIRWIYLRINGVRYDQVNVSYNKNEVYIKRAIAFTIWTPPLMIPWDRVREVREKYTAFSHLKTLVVDDPMGSTISFSSSDYDKMASAR